MSIEDAARKFVVELIEHSRLLMRARSRAMRQMFDGRARRFVMRV
jgi:hypothetical protein